MPQRSLIVVGASAGGMEAVVKLARDLPRDLPAAVLAVARRRADILRGLREKPTDIEEPRTMVDDLDATTGGG